MHELSDVYLLVVVVQETSGGSCDHSIEVSN